MASPSLITPLAQAVPAQAARILDVGCGDGRLGKIVKELGGPGRAVFGVEADATAAAAAARHLDRVFHLDIERDVPPIEAASIDCILLDEILEKLADPLAVLRRLRSLLHPDGVILCRVANAQHFKLLSALFTNDFQYFDECPPRGADRRFFTLSSLMKLLLDAECLPNLVHTTISPCSDAFLQAATPLAEHFRISAETIHERVSSAYYVVQAFPMPPVDAADEPMSFVVCSNDPMQLANNLAASPCFKQGRHELLVYGNAESAADGINAGLQEARHPMVVALHQDIYLPETWPARFQAQWRTAERMFGDVGLAGVFGVSLQGGRIQRTGQIVDGARLIALGLSLPADASSLDEVVLAFPKDTKVRLDPAMGWHCYGTDAALQAAQFGQKVAILDAPCLHNTRFSGLGRDFVQSAKALAEKWPEPRPLHTTCVKLTEDSGMSGW